MGPGGEFAFVALGLATLLGIIGTPAANFMLAVTSLTMAMIPLLAMAAHRITSRLERHRATNPELTVPPPAGLSAHAIVIGHGRVGQIVCAMLEHHHFPFIASDSDPAAVFSQPGCLVVLHGLPALDAFQNFTFLVRAIRREQKRHGPAFGLCSRIPVEPLRTSIPCQNDSIQRLTDNCVVRRLNYRCEVRDILLCRHGLRAWW